jgi:hypothetical protein
MVGIQVLSVHMPPAVIAAALIASSLCRGTPLGESAFQVATFFL